MVSFSLFQCNKHASHLPWKQEPDILLSMVPMLTQSIEKTYYAKDDYLRNNSLYLILFLILNKDLFFIVFFREGQRDN